MNFNILSYILYPTAWCLTNLFQNTKHYRKECEQLRILAPSAVKLAR